MHSMRLSCGRITLIRSELPPLAQLHGMICEAGILLETLTGKLQRALSIHQPSAQTLRYQARVVSPAKLFVILRDSRVTVLAQSALNYLLPGRRALPSVPARSFWFLK